MCTCMCACVCVCACVCKHACVECACVCVNTWTTYLVVLAMNFARSSQAPSRKWILIQICLSCSKWTKWQFHIIYACWCITWVGRNKANGFIMNHWALSVCVVGSLVSRLHVKRKWEPLPTWPVWEWGYVVGCRCQFCMTHCTERLEMPEVGAPWRA